MNKHFGQAPLEGPRFAGTQIPRRAPTLRQGSGRARAIASGRKAESRRFLTGQAQSRRQLLAGVLRYATLGLLGAVSGSVVARRSRLVREGKCVNRGVCRGCEIFKKCGLPQALSAKQVLARMGDGRK